MYFFWDVGHLIEIVRHLFWDPRQLNGDLMLILGLGYKKKILTREKVVFFLYVFKGFLYSPMSMFAIEVNIRPLQQGYPNCLEQ